LKRVLMIIMVSVGFVSKGLGSASVTAHRHAAVNDDF
jgi:hypothetical protein